MANMGRLIHCICLCLLLLTVFGEDEAQKSIKRSGPDMTGNMLQLNGKLYYFQTILKANFFQAVQFCNSIGMQLLSITSEEENAALEEYAEAFRPAGEYLTSGTSLTGTGQWTWFHSGTEVNFTKWAQGEPNNLNREKCIVTSQGKLDPRFTWNNVPCDYKFYFICESVLKYGCSDIEQFKNINRHNATHVTME